MEEKYIYNLDWQTTEELFDVFVGLRSIKVFYKDNLVKEFKIENRMFQKIVNNVERNLRKEIKSTLNHVAGHFSTFNTKTMKIV